ncbi:hypothetical protein C8Q77DRAFT_1053976 [Trametes polyzona]|nr:hypothetical protein C8Q77DRAFT_1053976 [Trametes polyzona]
MTTTLNLSSVIVMSYPDTSPWDIRPKLQNLDPGPEQLEPGPDFSMKEVLDLIAPPARNQAKKAGKNPFYFMCGDNPLLLDHPDAAAAAEVPLQGYTEPTPLQQVDAQPFSLLSMRSEEDGPASAALLVRVLFEGGERRVLKMYFAHEWTSTADDAAHRFSTEMAAYSHFVRFGACESRVVPKCYGWMELDRDALTTALDGSSDLPAWFHGRITRGLESGCGVRALVLEDLSGAEPLSIHNISRETAIKVMQSLHRVHSSFVLHGALDRRRILIVQGEDRVVWVGFSHAKCGSTLPSRRELLHELAQLWSLVYEKLLPDALIGLEDDDVGRSLWDRPMIVPWTATGRALVRRPLTANIRDEIKAVLYSYPVKNLFDWDPPIYNLAPAVKDDDQYDTPELISAIFKVKRNQLFDNPFYRWYGTCPLTDPFPPWTPGLPKSWGSYKVPDSLPEILPATKVEILRCVDVYARHPMFKVRLDGEERLLKVFCGGWPKSEDEGAVAESRNDLTPVKKEYFAEVSAYAHLLQYGACEAGVVPRCYGWLYLSAQQITVANGAIAEAYMQTKTSASLTREAPTFVAPIFNDGGRTTGIVLEYISNAQALSLQNISPSRAELVLRAFARIHAAFVVRGDYRNVNNILLVEGSPDRIVIVDFDRAENPVPPRRMPAFLSELARVWHMMYWEMVSRYVLTK